KLLFRAPAVAALTLLNVVGVAAFIWLLATRSDLSVTLDGAGLPVLFGVIAFLIVTHEMAHAVPMVHIGRPVPDAGFGLTCLLPGAYVNITASWMSTKRGRRTAVVAGPLLTLTQASIATLLLPFVSHPLARMVLVDVSVFGYLLFVLNANPLFEGDGY